MDAQGSGGPRSDTFPGIGFETWCQVMVEPDCVARRAVAPEAGVEEDEIEGGEEREQAEPDSANGEQDGEEKTKGALAHTRPW